MPTPNPVSPLGIDLRLGAPHRFNMRDVGKISLDSIAALQAAVRQHLADGYRIDVVFPAHEPQSVLLSRDKERVCLATHGAPQISSTLPGFKPAYILSRASGGYGEGRAGMRYRDLIPGRLGGRYIGSHITVEAGGPVDDWVHYHHVALQLIVVRRGWVKVVYEDQGDAFVMTAGDMVLQPPTIRHRVLESSPDLEVIELAAPALHETFADHALALPNVASGRSFGGQDFMHHRAAEAPWEDRGCAQIQSTGLAEATGGMADARFLRLSDPGSVSSQTHDGELVFVAVLNGRGILSTGKQIRLDDGDCVVIPPTLAWSVSSAGGRLDLLHVSTRELHLRA